MLLAIDPGTNSPGVALFNGAPDYELRFADRVNARNYKDLADGQRWLAVAESIVGCVNTPIVEGLGTLWNIRTIVFERPQWYAAAKSKGDPNQLAGIAGVAANVTGIISRHTAQPLLVESPTPAEWIGQLSKVCPACKGKARKKCAACKGSDWETPRGRYIRGRLSPAELALVPDQNDAIDAVGLGLWALGRLTPRRVFSNGRDQT